MEDVVIGEMILGIGYGVVLGESSVDRELRGKRRCKLGNVSCVTIRRGKRKHEI